MEILEQLEKTLVSLRDTMLQDQGMTFKDEEEEEGLSSWGHERRTERPRDRDLLKSHGSTLEGETSSPEAADVQTTESPSEGHGSPIASPQSDPPEVELQGWVHLWEKPDGIPPADISWLKDDEEKGLFSPVQTYRSVTGQLKRRRVMNSDEMWFYPPGPPVFVAGALPSAHVYFRSRVFVWRPVGVWRCSLKCPRGEECAGKGTNVHLYKSGYHHRVRHICDVSSWYTMITEVLCCGPCTKAGRGAEGGTVGRWLAWDPVILSQLDLGHQADFPAILTGRRGVDKAVVRLLRDRTEGNTVAKVWRQIQENHAERYFGCLGKYTAVLMTVAQPRGIVSAFGHTFQPPPPQRELPSPQLLRHAFLLSEAENVQDYRSQILSTFGSVLKMDSTKKVVKKLSGAGRGSAECFTCIGNENSQILSFVLTCEESTQKLEPMCRGLMERFRLADQPVPKILYVPSGCCCAEGPTAVEALFQPWTDSGMVTRLDIFHWIRRFDAAICSARHSKYAMFKSAVAGAVLAYNHTDLELLIKAVRAKAPATMASVSDEDVLHHYISEEQLKHHVRRITLGAHETFRLMQLIIEELKGPAGLDVCGVSLFKTPEAIDEMWAAQKRHLECIQDPPGMNMYRVTRTTTINKIDVPYYKCLRGSSSLEGFFKFLPHMIPGPHCAARPYQVYLMSGIARWNSDRSSDAVFGGKGRQHMIYSAALIQRLNTHCQQLFGFAVEENFQAPADVPSTELLGLEYLFSQSTGESEPFSLQGIIDDGPDEEEEVFQSEDEACQSDTEAHGDPLDGVLRRITTPSDDTSTVHPPSSEDVCRPSPLPGLQKLEAFCSVLVEAGLTEDRLPLATEQRNKVLSAWNAVEEHDKQLHPFSRLYGTHWDTNRLMCSLIRLLWLRSGSHAAPEKSSVSKAYERIQRRIVVEDQVLSKAGIPLPKISIRTVRDFICHQESLLNLHAAPQQPSSITNIISISSVDLPPAPHLPAVLPPPSYPTINYVDKPCTAGTKVLKVRKDMKMFLSRIEPPLPAKGPRATSTATRPPASAAASDTSVPPTSWSRATQYKRKLMDESEGDRKPSRMKHLPLCRICNQAIQGHNKYKKKNFCPVKMMSSSPGLDSKVYGSYAEFTAAVDALDK